MVNPYFWKKGLYSAKDKNGSISHFRNFFLIPVFCHSENRQESFSLHHSFPHRLHFLLIGCVLHSDLGIVFLPSVSDLGITLRTVIVFS